MPNLNGTGPQGQGPLTGRRSGRCRDTEKAEAQNKSSESKEVIYGLGRGGRPRAVVDLAKVAVQEEGSETDKGC